jgi:hypothetical protein
LFKLKIIIIFFIIRNILAIVFFNISKASVKSYYMELCFFGVQLSQINIWNKTRILKILLIIIIQIDFLDRIEKLEKPLIIINKLFIFINIKNELLIKSQLF